MESSKKQLTAMGNTERYRKTEPMINVQVASQPPNTTTDVTA
ncbi:MAG: hypothetical protein R3E58_13080 [Phycisphaerae bacterium]